MTNHRYYISELLDYVSFSFVQLIKFCLKIIPTSIRLGLTKAMGRFYGRLPHAQSKAVISNFEVVLPNKKDQAPELCSRVFENFALNLHDFFLQEGIQMTVENPETWEKVKKIKSGVIILTFHVGQWEFGSRTLLGADIPLSAVYQSYESKWLKDLIETHRTPGVDYLPVGKKTAQHVITALKKGSWVAMLGDRSFGEKGTWVSLGNKTVRWPKGPAVLAAKAHVPIVMAAVMRKGPQSYTTQFEEPIWVEGKTAEAIQTTTQRIAHQFHTLVQQKPDQWYRFQPYIQREKPRRLAIIPGS